jgi:hypothetical protein
MILGGGAFAGWKIFFDTVPQQVATSTPQNSFDNLQGDKFNIRTRGGQSVTVPDFRDDASSTTFGNDTYYQLTNNEETQGDDATFDIEYSSDNSVSIFLLKEPLKEARLAAEAELKKFFPLSDEELCDLDVIVGVPIDISETYAGENLGLSFCPDSTYLQ